MVREQRDVGRAPIMVIMVTRGGMAATASAAFVARGSMPKNATELPSTRTDPGTGAAVSKVRACW